MLFDLYLEIFGNDSSVISFVKDDTSYHIKSELAKWLYLNYKFIEWETFVSSEVSNLSEDKINNIFSNLESTDGYLDVYRAMVSLNLNNPRNMDRFTEQLLFKNPAALKIAPKMSLSTRNFLMY